MDPSEPRATSRPPPGGSRERALDASELSQHRALLTGLARRLTKSAADADDLVQDTIERALVKGRDIPPEKIRSWLITVLNNLFIDRCRQSARRKHVGDDAIAQLPTPIVEPSPQWHKLDGAALRAAIDQLPNEFSDVYRRHALQKQSYAEISEQLGVPSATVGTRLLRARKKLKEILMKTLAEQADAKPKESL